MADVLKAAYANAQKLAGDLSGNVAADNKGFTHYFGGPEADIQLQQDKKMMQGIANSDINYNISAKTAANSTGHATSWPIGSLAGLMEPDQTTTPRAMLPPPRRSSSWMSVASRRSSPSLEIDLALSVW